MSSVDNNIYDDDLDELDYYWKLSSDYIINHMMTSRQGVVSAALKCGDNGYIQRKMVKIMRQMRDPIYDQQDDQ